MLIVSVDAMLAEESSADQTLTARFRSEETGGETDDDQDIRTAVP